MKFDDAINDVINEDLEEDIFMDALDDDQKKKLVIRTVTNLGRSIISGEYGALNRKRIIKVANKLDVMSKHPMLRHYMEQELPKYDMDMTDIEYIAKYGLVWPDQRAEEKRKQRGLGNLK